MCPRHTPDGGRADHTGIARSPGRALRASPPFRAGVFMEKEQSPAGGTVGAGYRRLPRSSGGKGTAVVKGQERVAAVLKTGAWKERGRRGGLRFRTCDEALKAWLPQSWMMRGRRAWMLFRGLVQGRGGAGKFPEETAGRRRARSVGTKRAYRAEKERAETGDTVPCRAGKFSVMQTGNFVMRLAGVTQGGLPCGVFRHPSLTGGRASGL